MTSIAILIPSCDAFSDMWGPCLTCIRKFWHANEWPVFTISNGLDFGPESGNIKTLTDRGWCHNLLYALSRFPYTHVCMFLEDMLVETVDQGRVLEAWEIVQKSDEIVGFRIGPGGELYYHPSKDQRLAIIRKNSNYRISTSPTIWRVEYLRTVVSKVVEIGYDSAAAFEITGTLCAASLPGEIMKWIDPPAIGCQYTAVTRGKLERGTLRFFEQHGIEYTGTRELCGA